MKQKRFSIKIKDFQENIGIYMIFPLLLRYFLTELNNSNNNEYININLSKDIGSIIYSVRPLHKYKKVTHEEMQHILYNFCDKNI